MLTVNAVQSRYPGRLPIRHFSSQTVKNPKHSEKSKHARTYSHYPSPRGNWGAGENQNRYGNS